MSTPTPLPPLDPLLPVFESVAQHFSVLAEPARLRILHAVCRGERCVNDIIQMTGLAQANASRHLARLYQAGLLERRREGTQIYYRAADSSCLDVCRLVAQQVLAQQPHPIPGVGCDVPSPMPVFPVESKENNRV